MKLKIQLALSLVLAAPLLSQGQTTPLPHPGVKAMELAWFHPKETPAIVEAFDHIEVGFKLPMEIRKDIEDYLNGRPVPDALNPFDPKDLDVRGVFTREVNGVMRTESEERIGFWYREYERDMSSENPDDWKHKEIATNYAFRIRFTPKETGKYRVKTIIILRGTDTLSTNETTFDVSEGNRKGFLQMGDNRRFLVRDQHSFFPVGQNLPWPTCDKSVDPLCEQIYCAGKEAWCHARIMGPYGFLVYQNEMEQLSESGANYMRLLIAPWNLEIEFEELNNYDGRMHCAWETDKILEKAEELGMLLHLNLQVHYPLENPSVYSMYHWDYGDLECSPWDEPYCYYDELNLRTPRDFLASQEARLHYQNRLRYMIARYGYATSIGVLELLSEANNTGKGWQMNDQCLPDWSKGKYEPYYQDPGMAEVISSWHWEMARYIKEDLLHTDHLLAFNYTGAPSVELNDQSFYSPHVDIASWNSYYLSIDKPYGTSRDISNFQQARQRAKVSTYDPEQVDKPIMFGEVGPGLEGIHECDNNIRWIKAAWMSSFTGLAGAAINWNKQHHPELWKNLANINVFMEGIELDAGDFLNVRDQRQDKLAELVALRSTDGERIAVGAIHNRTVNFYTMRDTSTQNNVCGNIGAITQQVLPEVYRRPQVVAPDKGKNKLSIFNMGLLKHYEITYYSPVDLSIIETSVITSTLRGRLHLNHPSLPDSGVGFIVFKLRELR